MFDWPTLNLISIKIKKVGASVQPGLCSANQREAKRHHSKGKGEGSIEAGTFIRFRTAGALAAPHANIFHPAESEFAKRKSSASRFRVSLRPRCKMKD